MNKNTLLGIHISGNNIHALELSYSKTSQEYTIENSSTTIINQAQFKNQKAAIAIPYSQAIFKEINIGSGVNSLKLSNTEIKNIIKLNLDIKNFNFDYFIQDDSLNIIAAPKNIIDYQITLLKKLGAAVIIIDLNTYALERVIRSQIKNITKPIAAINIDTDNIFSIILDQTKILHTYETQSIHQAIEQIKSHSPEQLIISGNNTYSPPSSILKSNIPITTISSIPSELVLSYGLAMRASNDT